MGLGVALPQGSLCCGRPASFDSLQGQQLKFQTGNTWRFQESLPDSYFVFPSFHSPPTLRGAFFGILCMKKKSKPATGPAPEKERGIAQEFPGRGGLCSHFQAFIVLTALITASAMGCKIKPHSRNHVISLGERHRERCSGDAAVCSFLAGPEPRQLF